MVQHNLPCRVRARPESCRLLVGFLLGILAAGGFQAASSQTGSGRTCGLCHQNVVAQFELSVHSRLATFELRGLASGCEACHGSGTKHAASANTKDIVGFKGADADRPCLACHADGAGLHWRQSDHAMNGVACIECHKIHQARPQGPVDRALLVERPLPAVFRAAGPPVKASLAKPESVLCLECHKTVGSKMMLSSRHPVREGKMDCSSCHAVHGADAGNLKTAERQNDLCLSCHSSKQGPFVFDHSPVSEDCGICHVPHGSVSNNLLKQNEPFLCLQCHEAHFHIGRTGISTPVMNPSGGSQNPFGESGFRRAFGTKCTQCHIQIHGSDLPSQSITSRGRSLTR